MTTFACPVCPLGEIDVLVSGIDALEFGMGALDDGADVKMGVLGLLEGNCALAPDAKLRTASNAIETSNALLSFILSICMGKL